MEKMKNNFVGAAIIKQSDNLFNIESVFSIEAVCFPGSEVFEYLFKIFEFQEWQDSSLQRKLDLSDLNKTEKYQKQVNKFKQDIKMSKPKITIKIELEKYEE